MVQSVSPSPRNGLWHCFALRRVSAFMGLCAIGLSLGACQSAGAPDNPPGGREPPPNPPTPSIRTISRVFTLPSAARLSHVVVAPSGQAVYVATEGNYGAGYYLYSFDPHSSTENWRYKIPEGFQTIHLRPTGNIVILTERGTIYEITPVGELVYHVNPPQVSKYTKTWLLDSSVITLLTDGNFYTLESNGTLTLLRHMADVPGDHIPLSGGRWLSLEASTSGTILDLLGDEPTPLWSATVPGSCAFRAEVGTDILLRCWLVKYQFGETYRDATLVKVGADGVATTLYETERSSPEMFEHFTPMHVTDGGEVYFLQTALASAEDTVSGRYLVGLEADGTVKWKREWNFRGSGGLFVTPAGDVVAETFERYENRTYYSPRLSGFDLETAIRTWHTRDIRFANMRGIDAHGRLWIFYGDFGSSDNHIGYIRTYP